jgi:hypothetical protein
MKNHILIFIALIITSSCTTLSGQRGTCGYEDGLLNARTIEVLPSSSVVNNVEIGGKLKRADNYEYYVEELINQRAVYAFDKLGYRSSLISKAMLHDNKISREYSIAYDSFRENKLSMYTTPLIDIKKALNWQDSSIRELDKISNIFDADLYVFFDYEGMVKTSGNLITEVAIKLAFPTSSSSPKESWAMYGCIANPKKILWCNIVATDEPISGMMSMFTSKKKQEQNHIDKMLENLLEPITQLRKQPNKRKR